MEQQHSLYKGTGEGRGGEREVISTCCTEHKQIPAVAIHTYIDTHNTHIHTHTHTHNTHTQHTHTHTQHNKPSESNHYTKAHTTRKITHTEHTSP